MEKQNKTKKLFCKLWYDFVLNSAWIVKFHYMSTFWGLKINEEKLLIALKVYVCYAMVRFCSKCWVDLPVFTAYIKLFQNQTLYTDGGFELSLCPR